MIEKEPEHSFDYRAISDRIHADYEKTELAKRTRTLMKQAYTAIHAVSVPGLDDLFLRCDRDVSLIVDSLEQSLPETIS